MFSPSIYIDYHSSETIKFRAALPESKLRKSLFPFVYSHSKFAAILSGHRSFQCFHYRAWKAAIICELLSAVMDRYPRFLAQIFIVCRFVRVLESTPAANVVD